MPAAAGLPPNSRLERQCVAVLQIGRARRGGRGNGRGIDQFQRGAVAVGPAGPSAAVAIGEAEDVRVQPIHERDEFAAVAQGAGIGSGDAAEFARAVAGLEGGQILHHQHVIARGDFGDVAAGEIESDAHGELHAGQIDLRVARVFQFDELEIVAGPRRD